MPRRSARSWGSVDRGKHRRCIELRKHYIPEAEPVGWREGNTFGGVMRVVECSGGVPDQRMCGHVSHGNRETPERRFDMSDHRQTAGGKAHRRNPSARAPGESDGNIVPKKSANKGTAVPAESMEERKPTERNTDHETANRVHMGAVLPSSNAVASASPDNPSIPLRPL